LNEISNYCISSIQYKEFYSCKLKPGLVAWFLTLLLDHGIKQIGLNEIRHCFNLKEQKIDLMKIVKEEFKDENLTDKNNKTLIYLQEQIKFYSSTELGNSLFWPEDITVAEETLDKHFPQVRKLFKLRFKEMEIGNKSFNNVTVDLALDQFILMSDEINDSFRKSNSKSMASQYDSTFNCSNIYIDKKIKYI